MAPTLDELQRKVAELEGYARQVQEMKSTISDFSTKLKAKDITIMKLQQSLKALEGSRDVQLKPESPMANEIVISEAWKAQEAEWKSQERRLLQQIKDLRSMVSETIKPSSTPSTVGIHNTKTGDQAFDVLYISKISEEQQKSKQLQQELDLLKSEIAARDEVIQQLSSTVSSPSMRNVFLGRGNTADKSTVQVLQEVIKENIRMRELLTRSCISISP